jgi:hypothetical protein
LRGRGHEVERDDFRAFGRQVLYDVAADVAAAADDHDFHAASKPVTLPIYTTMSLIEAISKGIASFARDLLFEKGNEIIPQLHTPQKM